MTDEQDERPDDEHEPSTASDEPEPEPATEPTEPVELAADPEPADDDDPDDDSDTFPREYVERLRRENQTYRDRARAAESTAWRALVESTGLVVNADEVPRPDGAALDLDGALAAAREAIAARPYIAARRARGNIGQHEGPGSTTAVSLSSLLRAGA